MDQVASLSYQVSFFPSRASFQAPTGTTICLPSSSLPSWQVCTGGQFLLRVRQEQDWKPYVCVKAHGRGKPLSIKAFDDLFLVSNFSVPKYRCRETTNLLLEESIIKGSGQERDLAREPLVQTDWQSAQWQPLISPVQPLTVRDCRKVAVGMAAAILLCLTPVPAVVDEHGVVFSDAAHAIAIPGPVDKLRKLEQGTEQIVEGFKSGKVVDKVLQVVSSQTLFTVDTVEKELKAVLDKDPSNDWPVQEIPGKVAEKVVENWSLVWDVLTKFDPFAAGVESITAPVIAFFEGFIERFTAFEVTMAVGIGERWLLFAPLVGIPMWWQMKRGRRQRNGSGDTNRGTGSRSLGGGSGGGGEGEGGGGGGGGGAGVVVDDETFLRGQRVRRELQRLELKASLAEALESVGPAALQPRLSGVATGPRREVEGLLMRLQELNPRDDPLAEGDTQRGPQGLSGNDSFKDIRPVPELDGEWLLTFVSTEGEDKDLPSERQRRQRQLSELPGVQLTDIRQAVRSAAPLRNTASVPEEADLVAHNRAEIRLGPLGRFQVSLEGKWRNQMDGQAAAVSFDSFSVRPTELLGAPVSPDLPPLTFAIPRGVQETGQWETVYLDDSIRINRGSRGTLYLFKRMGPA